MSDPSSENGCAARLDRLNRLMDEILQNESPADRDRRLQRFLAQAMSPSRRLELVAQMTDLLMGAHPASTEQTE